MRAAGFTVEEMVAGGFASELADELLRAIKARKRDEEVLWFVNEEVAKLGWEVVSIDLIHGPDEDLMNDAFFRTLLDPQIFLEKNLEGFEHFWEQG